MQFGPTTLSPAEEALRAEVREFLAGGAPRRTTGRRSASPAGTTRRSPGSSPPAAGSAWRSRPSTAGTGAARSTGSSSPRSCWPPARRSARTGSPTGRPARPCCTSAPRSSGSGSCPGIAAGEIYFSLGMSEPDSGSDLASVRTRATKVEGGWTVTGTKVWTSEAHHNHFFAVLCRTSPMEEGNKHAGLSQLIVDLHADGVHDLADPVPRRLAPLQRGRARGRLRARRHGARRDRLRLAAGDQRAGLRAQRPRPVAVDVPGAARVPARGGRQGGLRRGGDDHRALRRAVLGDPADVAVGGPGAGRRAGAGDRGGAGQGGRHPLRAGPGGGAAASRPRPSSTRSSGSLFGELLAEAVLTSPKYTLQGGTTEILRSVAAKGLGR